MNVNAFDFSFSKKRLHFSHKRKKQYGFIIKYSFFYVHLNCSLSFEQDESCLLTRLQPNTGIALTFSLRTNNSACVFFFYFVCLFFIIPFFREFLHEFIVFSLDFCGVRLPKQIDYEINSPVNSTLKCNVNYNI